MVMNDTELRHFKQYDFRVIASRMGYQLDSGKSGGNSFVLKGGNGDRIVTRLGSNGEWAYFNTGDTSDNGTILDFVQRRSGESLGHVRKAIRAMIGTQAITFSPIAQSLDLPSKSTTDYRKKAQAVWNSAQWMPAATYLVEHRGLVLKTLGDPRFFDTFRVTNKGAVLFPHFDQGGMCGFEYRSESFKGFGRDCHKGLWFSRNCRTAESIVVCESQIDCLSHYQLHGGGYAYVSHNGDMGPKQIGLIESVLVKAHGRNAKVIIATDNDKAGEGFYELFASIAPMELQRMTPISNDWNADVLALKFLDSW